MSSKNPHPTSDTSPFSEGDSASGTSNENPQGVGLIELLLEDFDTYERNPIEPGFWAVAMHRFGNWRMGIKPRVVRAPFSVLYKVGYTSINWLWGIDLSYTVKLGRRVRLWHHGGMVLTARSIGDDVVIRHNTTMGIARTSERGKRPTIEDRVEIGAGACILGDVTIGHDSIVGANAVVVKSFPPNSTIVGIPGRQLRAEDENGQAREPLPPRDPPGPA